VLDFFRLAAEQIRRELLDLARSLSRRPEVQAPAGEDSRGQGLLDRIDTTSEPHKLTIWAEYHRRVEELPDDERAVVDLMWYQGVKKKEAAELLGVSLATLARRWASARVKLQQVLRADPPAS
jgi:RNA polymerase sigma factor (sigma-70 family)